MQKSELYVTNVLNARKGCSSIKIPRIQEDHPPHGLSGAQRGRDIFLRISLDYHQKIFITPWGHFF